MSDAPRLVYTGNVIVDIVMTVGAIPAPGADTVASSSLVTAGGGYNVMVAAQRDGLPVVFAGQYGTGMFGDVVRGALDEAGFELVQPGLPDLDSGYCVALVDDTTERTFVTAVGAEGRLGPSDLDRVEVSGTDVVYVSGYSLAHPVNADALADWIGTIDPAALVLTDPSPLIAELTPRVLDAVLARTNVLTLNAREARLGSGLDDLEAAARCFLPRLPPGGTVLVRDSHRGAFVLSAATGDEMVLVPSFDVDAVDSNGAGDAHGGVLAAALARGDDLQSAVRRANAAAALAVTRFGPATAPTAPEIDALLAAALGGTD
jgi:sugar/nucleoside kinase (ribokinase family)